MYLPGKRNFPRSVWLLRITESVDYILILIYILPHCTRAIIIRLPRLTRVLARIIALMMPVQAMSNILGFVHFPARTENTTIKPDRIKYVYSEINE